MEEINLKDFWNYYKKFILGIMIVCLVFVVVTLIYNIAFKTPKYSTSTTIVLVKDEGSSPTYSKSPYLYPSVTALTIAICSAYIASL